MDEIEMQVAVAAAEARVKLLDPQGFVALSVRAKNFRAVALGCARRDMEGEGKTAAEAFALLNAKLDESDPALLAADFTGPAP